jgi:putative serine protease PepD
MDRMSTQLLRPTEPRNGHVPPEPPPPRRRRPGRALALVAAGLVGGAGATGILAAAGALDRTSPATTTVVRQAAAGSDTASAPTLRPAALYASASAGVVDITSKSVSGSSVPDPFGGGSQAATATGTGFVVDGSGHIVTAAHVVDGASSVTVTFQNGTTRRARVLGSDDATDLAVLSVDPSGLTLHPLALGRSGALRVGDALAAIGDPFHYARSLSTGIVSGVDRTIQAPNGFTVAHAIQTDAALNPGNSGGPVLVADGRVVGVVDQIATGTSGAEQSSGVGFLVPSDIVKAELPDLIAGRAVRHAYIGVSTDDAAGSVPGALVGSLAAGGPAQQAGLRAGDVVTAIDGAAVKGSSDLVAAIADHRPGDAIQVTLRRGGQTLTRTVRLGEQPARRAQSG